MTKQSDQDEAETTGQRADPVATRNEDLAHAGGPIVGEVEPGGAGFGSGPTPKGTAKPSGNPCGVGCSNCQRCRTPRPTQRWTAMCVLLRSSRTGRHAPVLTADHPHLRQRPTPPQVHHLVTTEPRDTTGLTSSLFLSRINRAHQRALSKKEDEEMDLAPDLTEARQRLSEVSRQYSAWHSMPDHIRAKMTALEYRRRCSEARQALKRADDLCRRASMVARQAARSGNVASQV